MRISKGDYGINHFYSGDPGLLVIAWWKYGIMLVVWKLRLAIGLSPNKVVNFRAI